MSRPALGGLLGCALLCAVGCAADGPSSRLPEFARPSAALHSGARALARLAAADRIRYRALTRHDFRGEVAPQPLGPHAEQMAAAICASIGPPPDTRAAVQRTPDGRYRARLEPVVFVTWMDRACSWWNDDGPFSEAYTLEHEQVHFGLYEVEARRLTREFNADPANLEAFGDTAEDAAARLQARVERALRDSLERVLARSLRFDEDTSGLLEPERQRAWAEELARLLGE